MVLWLCRESCVRDWLALRTLRISCGRSIPDGGPPVDGVDELVGLVLSRSKLGLLSFGRILVVFMSCLISRMFCSLSC